MRHFFFLLLLLSGFGAVTFAQQPVSALQAKLKSNFPDSSKISICLEISQIYAPGQPDSAVSYCNQGMKLAEKLNDKDKQGLILLQLGRINSLHHHPELARRFYNDALSIFRNLHHVKGVAMAYDELGLLDGEQQNITTATLDLGHTMKYYHDANDSTGVLTTYYDLGSVYEKKGEAEKALSFYLKALVQYEHRKEKPDAYFRLLERIGQLYLKKGDPNKALRYLQEGVNHSNTPVLRDTQINLLSEEGQVLEQEGEKLKALGLYKQALEVAKKFNRPQEQAKALVSIAGILKREDVTQSLVDLKKALQIADDIHQPQLQATIYGALAGVYRQQKDYKEAMIALEEHHRLIDSLLGADTTKEIAALDSSYVLESSREQIGSLKQVAKQEKAELGLGMVILIVVTTVLLLLWVYLWQVRRLNNELRASNRIKDTLFSVIGHDLKGPAGSASQLFEMMETEEFSEEELRGLIAELRKQTTASFDLLNTLFEWGNAQLQGVKANAVRIDTKWILNNNINLLLQQAVLKRIIITDHTAADACIFADRNQVDFVFRNLLSNAIKFTYEGGHIDIAMRKDQDEIIYSVKDDGVGISDEQQKQFLKTSLQVSFGTGGEKGSGLGLLLIKEFMKANRGRIWLESKKGEGTVFYVAFPKCS